MAKTKTAETAKSVTAFVNAVPDETKRADSFRLIEMMQEQSGFEPKMWGPTIIGFGSYHYIYESGHEGEMCRIGFSPRKAAFSLYLPLDGNAREKFLEQLGKYKAEKGCIYIKKLEDINLPVLKKMIASSLKYMKAKWK